jgi:hypothetical protein
MHRSFGERHPAPDLAGRIGGHPRAALHLDRGRRARLGPRARARRRGWSLSPRSRPPAASHQPRSHFLSSARCRSPSPPGGASSHRYWRSSSCCWAASPSDTSASPDATRSHERHRRHLHRAPRDRFLRTHLTARRRPDQDRWIGHTPEDAVRLMRCRWPLPRGPDGPGSRRSRRAVYAVAPAGKDTQAGAFGEVNTRSTRSHRMTRHRQDGYIRRPTADRSQPTGATRRMQRLLHDRLRPHKRSVLRPGRRLRHSEARRGPDRSRSATGPATSRYP